MQQEEEEPEAESTAEEEEEMQQDGEEPKNVSIVFPQIEKSLCNKSTSINGDTDKIVASAGFISFQYGLSKCR